MNNDHRAQPSIKIEEAIIQTIAILSADGKYRYRLTRTWDHNKGKAVVIMLNPSIADALKTDKTVMNITNFLIENNYGSVDIVNLFAYISTDPEKLSENRNTEYDSFNDIYIEAAAREADIIIIGWGRRKEIFIQERIRSVEKLLKPYKNKIKCFKQKEEEDPRHPRDLGKGWSLYDYEFIKGA